MDRKYNFGIIGCGDYLRCELAVIKASTRIGVKSLFDTDSARAGKYAAELGGGVVDDPGAIFDDPGIDAVCLFVPPWARRELIVRAASAGKDIITTKPLAPSVEDCAAMVEAVERKVRCGVFYLRTGNNLIETYKTMLESGEVGKLALVRHDWIHHYPQWNNWATDPAKNGGPFMDAEIHNMNFSRYLMGRAATHVTFFSDNHAHPELRCADTESMKLDFEGDGAAHLFITWAADLAVTSTEGNYREHIDITYFVTDQGWRLTHGSEGITASRRGEKKVFAVAPLAGTRYDRFIESLEKDADLPRDIAGLREAAHDIRIIRTGEKNPGRRVALEL